MSRVFSAEDLKAKGNEAHKNGQWNQAIDYYTQAIELDDTISTYYSNRAACYIKLKLWDQGLIDCEIGLGRKPDSKSAVKLYWRKGVCQRELQDPKGARNSFEQGLKLDAHNSILQQELNTLAWHDKKAARLKRTTLKTSTTKVNVQIVDSLPDKFKPAIISANCDSSINISKEEPTKKLFVPPIGDPITLYTLLQIMRSPKNDLPEVYSFVFSIPAETFETIHRGGAIDYEVIEFVLEAMISQANTENWFIKSMDLLTSLARCPRFGVSKMFISSSKLQAVFDLLEKAGLSRDKLDELKDEWT
jgi:hypothetical protein